MTSKQGKAFILSAPSGSGKTTILNYLLEKKPLLEFSISACTRPSRRNELHGKDYYFLSQQDFKERISSGQFIEWEEVYTGNYYGTLKSEVKRIWDKNHLVAFDVDVIGGLNLKKYFGAQALAVFVKVPDLNTLENRLKGRGSEIPEVLEKRLSKAKKEIAMAKHFDRSILNETLEEALQQAEQILLEFIG